MSGIEIDFQPDGTVVVRVGANVEQAQLAFDQLGVLLTQGVITNGQARKALGIPDDDDEQRHTLYREALGA